MRILIPELNHERVGALPLALGDQFGHHDGVISSLAEPTCNGVCVQAYVRNSEDQLNGLLKSSIKT